MYVPQTDGFYLRLKRIVRRIDHAYPQSSVDMHLLCRVDFLNTLMLRFYPTNTSTDFLQTEF